MSAETTTSGVDVDVGNAVVSVTSAAVLGLYASWIAADVLSRWLVFPVVTAAVGYGLYTRSDGHAIAADACYAAAGLVLVTPLFVVLPSVLSADAYGVSVWALTLTIANAILLVFFAIPAALLAYVGYHLDGGRGDGARVRDSR